MCRSDDTEIPELYTQYRYDMHSGDESRGDSAHPTIPFNDSATLCHLQRKCEPKQSDFQCGTSIRTEHVY
jgi:hypothetical protein